MPCRYDWQAIRAYYEEGHTITECRERFGFSPGAWDQAVTRGDVVPRGTPDPKRHSHKTRKAVAGLLERGYSQARISRDLRISKGTVAFHARNLGVPPDPRFSRRFDWQEIQRAYDSGLSLAECAEKFGFSRSSWCQAVERGDITPRPRATPIEEVFVNGAARNRYHLKRRMLEAGLPVDRCERCGITEWQGKALNMQLHHINGDGRDNRLENLELLCANCHSQTDTYGAKGQRRLRLANGN
jgi:hypothetical protein